MKPVTQFVEVWDSQGTQSTVQAAIWAPSLQTSFLASSGKLRLCLGLYAAKGLLNPLKSGFHSARYQLIEVTVNASSFGKARTAQAVVAQVCPHPLKFKQIWHLARGSKSLYAWQAIAPETFVALGMYVTTTENPPDVRCMRCVPRAWTTPTKTAPTKVWDDTGAGGGKPGSIWQINALGLIAVVPGHGAPTDAFYDLSASRFFLNE